MTPSDADDEANMQDDDRAPRRRRAPRDVLDIGRGEDRRQGGRGAEHARDLDEDDRDRRPRDDRGVRRDQDDGRDGSEGRKADDGKAKRDPQADSETQGKGGGKDKEAGKDADEAQNRRKSRRPSSSR